MIWVRIAQWMALAPLAVLGAMHLMGRKRDVSLWLLAGAFAVSWVADSLALSFPKDDVARWAISSIYPATQASIVGSVLIFSRQRAVLFALITHAAAAVCILLHGVEGPEYVSRIIAWGTICVIAGRFWQLGTLRTALLVYFGAGLVTWILHAEWLVVATWWPYQAARLVGLGWFCGSAWQERQAPRPTLVRSVA